MAKIIGEAGIRLRAESKTLATEIRRLVTTAIKQATADIKPDTDKVTDGIREGAEKTSNRVKGILGDLGTSLLSANTALLKTTGNVAGLTLKVASLASTVTGAFAVVGGLGEAVTGLGAAAGGVAVAGLTALIALSATLKIATSGVGEAFKAVASGDAAALQKALKNLAPAAREFVTETAKLKPVFDKIRLDTQTALFEGLGREVLQTGKALSSTFGTMFVSIAKQVNFAAKDVAGFLREARAVKDIESITGNVAGGFREVSAAARPIVQIIVDIVKSATALLPDMGRSIEDVARRFADFIRVKSDSGELTQFFRDGIETVKQFGRIIRDLGVGIANIFQIGSETGGGFLNTLEKIAKSFRDFTESASGQEILTTLFETIRTLSDAFGGLLSTLRPVLGPLGELAKVVAGALADALARIGPKLRDTLIKLFEKLAEAAPSLISAFEKIAESVLDLVDALAPLIPGIAKLVEGFADISGPAGVAAVALIALLGTKMGLVVAAGIGLGLLLIEVGKGIKSFVNEAGDDIESFGKDMQKLGGPFEALGRGLEIFGSGVGDSTGKVRELFRKQGVDIGTTLFEAVTQGVAKAQAEALVPGINGAITQILGIFNGRKGEFERAGGLTWTEVGNGIVTEQQAVVSRLNTAAQALLNFLTGKRNDFALQGKAFSDALANGLTTGQQEVINRVRNTIDNLLAAMTGRRPAFDAEGRAISDRLGDGITSNQGDPVGAARSVGTAVANTFENASLFSAGAAIMASLRSGLVSGIQAVRNVLTSMTSLIPTWKGPESKDKVLLVPAGKAIMGGLIKSIESEIPALRSTMFMVTDEIANALNPLNGSPLDFSPGITTAGGTAAAGVGGGLIVQQTNVMQPGADVAQFANEVWRRGAQDLASGNSALTVSQQPVQFGMALPGSVVHLGA